jgi:hypothetical protein
LLPYFIEGKCDFAYYDAMHYEDLKLLYSKKTICKHQLNQVIIVIANYFFDSIPQELFHITKNVVSECLIELNSKRQDPTNMGRSIDFDDINFTFEEKVLTKKYDEEYLNQILATYQSTIADSHILFPNSGLICLEGIKNYSKEGMMVLSMDKGHHLLAEIDNKPLPDFVTHGSFSFQVNFHAFQQYCTFHKGLSFFPEGSNFHVELACLLCLPNAASYIDTIASYEENVNDFGPDDYYGMTKNHYTTVQNMSMRDLLYLIRFSAFDSTFFYNIISSFKKSLKEISVVERGKISQNLHSIWNFYFNINEPFDLAFELGGMFFDLGYYEDAILYFDHSKDKFGVTQDYAYNKALCFFQLSRDVEFIDLIDNTMLSYPDFYRMFDLKKLLDPANLA